MTNLLNRRAALGALAGVPALALPAVGLAASCHDPIFAAIERHRAAFAAYCASINPADEVLAAQEGREVTAEDEEALNVASDAEAEALSELVNTAPTTLAGLRAGITYVIDQAHHFDIHDPTHFLRACLRSPALPMEPSGL
jgi:hypothetical protein